MDIQHAFRTAGILHNILMIHDELEYEYNMIQGWEQLDSPTNVTIIDEVVGANEFTLDGDVNMNQIILNYDELT
jgi:hypothetical protein